VNFISRKNLSTEQPGYCPGCDDELADIGPGEGVCLGCYLAEVRAGPL